jgi:hypothetical protein
VNPPRMPPGYLVARRVNDWGELLTAWFVGFLSAVGLILILGCPTLACAGGPRIVTWDQAADCASVQAWELLQAPITTANPNPVSTAATLGVTIPNSGPPCGLAMTRTVTVAGVGPTRFWIRAVAGTLRSDVSNPVDRSLPLAAPAGLSVVEP